MLCSATEHLFSLSSPPPPMKRLSSSTDSLLSFISMSTASHTDEMHFTDDIQAMLDILEEDDQNEMDIIHPKIGKKRRLSLLQVRALEKHFEMDYKLEPDRKVKLSLELGLHPRQVAVWFQNRRARCKNKQLEKEYEVLKSCYEELKQIYAIVVCQKEALNAELRDLKLKLAEASESESDNRNNIVNKTDHEPIMEHLQHQTWSCSSSPLMQLDGSVSYPSEDMSWFQYENGASGVEGGSTGPSWFNFGMDY